MKRNDMIKKMVACFNECKKMDYSDQQAMDRVLELQEEEGMAPPADSRTFGPQGGYLCQWEYDGENHE